MLNRFTQGSRVDAAERQRRLVTKEVRGDGGAFGLGDKLVQGFLNGHDALVQREGLKFGRSQVQPLQGPDR